MIPKTKFHFHVLKLHESIPPITDKQERWAYEHIYEPIAKKMSKGIVCTNCNHTWKDKLLENGKSKYCHCPNCNLKLEIDRSRKRVFNDSGYFGIITTFKGHQVFRLFYTEVKFQAGKTPFYICKEVVQRWIAKNGKTATLSVPKGSFCYYSIWRWWAPMELRKNDHPTYQITPYKTYPAVKFIPEIRRNGFTGEFYDIKPFDFYSLILKSNKAETLLKCGEIEWFKFAYHNLRSVEKCWPAIKMCLRYKRTIEDKRFWIDYIELLLFFGKDIHNPKVIFPKELKQKHDRLVVKKREIQRRQDLEKRKAEVEDEEAQYKKSKGKYFGVKFSDGLISIKVLDSVLEVIKEGDIMHHCIYTNDYHKKSDSLLLSATVKGKRVETVEFSLKQMKVLQSRGVHNTNTEYHDRILKLVEKNIPVIQKVKIKKKGNLPLLQTTQINV